VYTACEEADTVCEEAGYILLVTADHGNAEQMLNPDTSAPHTAHTTNAVPFIMTGDPEKFKFVLDKDKGEEEEDEGALSDVVPIVLDLLGLDQPGGKSCLWRFRRCWVIADSVLVQR
jgi:2,3-bisphosphoglycerate-independent phosphoglycerate mutase